MIKNSLEYDFTNSIINQFNERKLFLKNQRLTQEIQYEMYGIDAISKELKQQLQWYDAVRNGNIVYNKIESLEEIAKVLIGKRIQLNISQGKIAEIVGMSEEDYKRLENDDFYGLSPVLLQKILLILELDNPNHILEKNYDQLYSTIEFNLKKIKINLKFMSSSMPITMEQVQEALQRNLSSASYLMEKFLESFRKMFLINLEDDISESNYNSKLAVAFKRKINVSEDNLTFTTAYAAYILGLAARQMPPTKIIKADPITIREIILDRYGVVDIETCLSFIWSLNITIIPLNLHSSFHGACFDFDGTKAIALSQQNQTVSRWKFDMLHELYHALTMEYSAYIEKTEIMEQDDEEEKLASEFASYVIFGQEMDSFIKLVLEKSDWQIERIKNNIISISHEFDINIDDFSNYVAYRISKKTVNFWGGAANLQKDKRSPVAILRDYLYTHLNVNEFNSFELESFQKALNQEVF